MRPLLRASILLLGAFSLGGCGLWQGRLQSPREALADPEAGHVRLTRTNGERVEVRVAEVRGDSIYGTLGGSGPLTCRGAVPSCSARIPVADVGFVEVRAFSLMRTVAVVAAPLGVLAIAALGADRCSQARGTC